jgi:hypothetical protein
VTDEVWVVRLGISSCAACGAAGWYAALPTLVPAHLRVDVVDFGLLLRQRVLALVGASERMPVASATAERLALAAVWVTAFVVAVLALSLLSRNLRGGRRTRIGAAAIVSGIWLSCLPALLDLASRHWAFTIALFGLPALLYGAVLLRERGRWSKAVGLALPPFAMIAVALSLATRIELEMLVVALVSSVLTLAGLRRESEGDVSVRRHTHLA